MARVGITGSYGGCNLGDEAILGCMIAQLRASLPVEITVFTGDPADTLSRHEVDHASLNEHVGLDDLRHAIEPLDLFIVGGGGILYDHWLAGHLREMRIALDAGVPLMVYAVGVGPLTDLELMRGLRECLDEADAITVRDIRSRHALEKLGVDGSVIVTADPALLLEPEPLPEDAWKREGLEGEDVLVGMSVREPGPAAPDMDVDTYLSLLAGAADYIVERYDAEVVFVPMEPNMHDTRHSHAVIAKMHRPTRATVLRGQYSAGQLLSLAERFTFAVGMRLHFLVFSALRSVPFVALPYASKVMGFVEELQMETPPLKDLSIGHLIAYIDRSWDRRDALRRLIVRGLPTLQERARDNNRIAVELLTRTGDRSPAPTRV